MAFLIWPRVPRPTIPFLSFSQVSSWAGEGLSTRRAYPVLGQNICTGPGARPQGETGHGPPTASAFGGRTLGKQEQPPSTPDTEKEGTATDPPPVPGPGWAWTSTCDLPELMPGPQGAGGAPTMSLGKLSPVGWVSSSHGKRRLTADMISPPLGDFRHTMHVGRGGDVFGDTSFLSNHGGSSGGTHRSPRSFLAKKLQQVRRVGVLPRRIASPPSASPAPPAVSPIIKNAISLPQLNQAAYDSLVVSKLSFNSSPAGSADGHSSYGERLGDLPVFPMLRRRGLNGSTSLPGSSFPHSSLVSPWRSGPKPQTVEGEGSEGGNQPTPQNTQTNLDNHSHGQKPEALPALLGREGEAGAVLMPLDSSPGNQGSGSCCHLVAIPCLAALPHHRGCLQCSARWVSAQNPAEGWSQRLDFWRASFGSVTSRQSDPGCWFHHCDQPTFGGSTFSHQPHVRRAGAWPSSQWELRLRGI